MNEAKMMLVIVICALVLVPIIFKLVLKIYQDFDYKRQLDGKIPERKYQGSNPPDISEAIGSDVMTSERAYKESCDTELRMRGMQNLIGPK